MNKDINYYMNLNYRIEMIKNEEGEGYTAYCPELRGCITCADSIENCVEMIEDAKMCWFTACIEDNIQIPLPSDLENYSGQFKIRIPKSLHRTLANRSKQEGVSMNQLCLYLLAEGVTS